MLKIALSILVIYVALLLILYVAQRKLIYFPFEGSSTPAEAGVPEMEVLTLQTEDGLTLKAWYRPAIQGQPTILYLHGNAGHIGHRGFVVKPFLEEGFGVLLLTYRGYSGNPGTPHEQGLYADARAALRFLEQQGVPSALIILYGNSIGAAVAVQMATEFPVGALILQSPFTSLADVGNYHYPFFPIRPFLKDQYDSIGKVENINVPVLMIHGESDDIIPPKLSQKLFEKLSEPKQAEYIPEKGHNDLFEPALIIRFIKDKKHSS